MRQADPVAVLWAHAQDVAHDVDLKHVKVLVDAGAQQGLKLVGARFDLVAVRLLGDRQVGCRIVDVLCRNVGGWSEPERGRGRVEKTLFDAVEGALGEDVDAVDDVVEEGLFIFWV